MALKRFTEVGLYGIDPIKNSAVVTFEDFTDEYALTSDMPVTGTSPWIGTSIGSGGLTVTNTDTVGGVLLITNDNSGDNIGAQVQRDIEHAVIQANKDIVYGCRFQLATPDQAHFFAGLGITDTSFLSGADGTAMLANTASLGFAVLDDLATLYLIAGNGASTIVGQQAVATVTAATWMTAEFVMHGESTAGNGTFDVYINGSYVCSTRFTGMSTTEMTETIAYVAGAAGAATAQRATIDWTACACER